MADISKITLPDGSEYNIKDANAQEKILVNGILEGDGEGGITASDIMDYETDTASGSVVSFTADSAAPFKSFIVNYEATQNYRGYDKPWAGGQGKNKFNVHAIQQSSYMYCIGENIYFPWAAPQPYSSGKTLGQLADLIVGETYYLRAEVTPDGGNYILLGGTTNKWEFNTQRTITERDLEVLVLFVPCETQMTFNAQIYAPMIQLASITDYTYVPYANICPIRGCTQRKVWVKPTHNVSSNPTATIHLNQTVYSGNLDIISGVLTTTSAEIPSYNGETLPGEWLSDRELYDPESTPTTGAQVVYTLDTPIISHLTPIEISTLQGANNVWADAEDVTVTYRIGENALLRDVAEAVENLQGKINVNGILKSNGNGEVFLAEPGTDYATPSQIPTVPSASDATPEPLGTAAAGTSNNYSRADHVHDMPSAADVGALASDGTAVGASNLRYSYRIDGTNGVWFQFMQFTLSDNVTTKFLLFFTDGGNGYQGLLNCRFHHTSGGSISTTVRWWARNGYSIDDIRYTVDQTTETITLYIHKRSPSYILFYNILSSDRSGYKNILSYFTALQVSEPTTATNALGIVADRDANGDQIDTTYLKKTETAVSSYTLFPTKVYPGTLAIGWYKFAEVNITATTGRAKISFKYGLANSNYDFIGDIFVYKTNSTTMNCTMQIPYSVSGKTTYFRYNVDSATTVSLYVYKHDSSGPPVFTFITSEDINGNYLDPSTYMLESLVAETPPATALKPLYSAINRWIYNVPVSPGTNQQILSYSHNMITSASVLAKIEFANPEYIKSDCSWETTDGANPNNNGTITLTGTCTTATTANLLILNVVEG